MIMIMTTIMMMMIVMMKVMIIDYCSNFTAYGYAI